ncbi:N-acetyltransferase [Cellulomonas hominis]|uniref:N-acetyltransferase n=2 Tax=Cellulomonas hominis TaxID=156981 RepID=A0A511FF44_9CELL|nr:N-acetyltransferase [Cellulomonas hominis]
MWHPVGMSEQRREHVVRPAEPQDAAGIARVHVQTWQQAYADLVPASYLSSLDVERRTQVWQRDLASGSRIRAWVATAGDDVVGFISLGPSLDEDAERHALQVYAIYLEPDMWGSGAARELLRTALADVPPRIPVTLWVFAENERARHFYRRHGFQPDGTERTEEVGGADLLQIRYRRR